MILIQIFNWIKNNFINVIVISLLIVMLLQRCGGPKSPVDKPIIKRDTVWVIKQNTIISKPVIVKTIPGKPGTEYKPDPNYDKLVKQYQKIVEEYIAQNIHKDSIKIDSIGYINITDTVTKNKIIGRKTSYSLKYPVITNTITLPPEKRNQLYIGGGLQGSQDELLNQFNAGILLKNKKDQIYGIYTGIDTDGQVQFGIQSYWKISFRKNK